MMQNQESLLPPQSSTIAPDVDTLFYFIFYTGLVIFAIVLFGLIFFSFRYRRRKGQPLELTSGVDKNTKLEWLWTIIPTILVIIVFVWGFKTFLKMNIPPKDGIVIKVTAKKWIWMFDYPDGRTMINDLVVPIDTPIKLLMSSEDVIHSFFVPNFRVKMDVLPNRYTVAWFEATAAGHHDIFCAEYCGEGHSKMLGTVTVLPKLEFLAWKDSENNAFSDATPLDEQGAKIFIQKGCNACHTVNGKPSIGPTMLALFDKTESFTNGSKIQVDENYLRKSILEPQSEIVNGYQPVMPTYQGLINNRELDALVAYIKSIKDN